MIAHLCISLHILALVTAIRVCENDELGGDQKAIFTISDGAVVTASGGKGDMRWKPDLSGYTDPVVAAGDSAAAEEIIGDPSGTCLLYTSRCV